MFSHMTVGTNDLPRSTRFYDAVLGVLDIRRTQDYSDHGWVGYGPEEAPAFWVGKPFNGEAATFGNGVTVAFNAQTRAQVDQFHVAALKNGGTDEGAPGLRPQYHPNCYAAYMRDPDGNKLCCVCHLPA